MNKSDNGQDLLTLEESCLLILCGPTRSGKSHFARRWFRETEIVSMDHMKQLVFDKNIAGYESPEAESLLFSLVEHRLHSNRFTVVDACCLKASLRRRLVHMARHFQMPVYLLMMDTSREECEDRLSESNDLARFRLISQFKQMQSAAKMSGQEGYSKVFRFSEFGPTGPLPLRQPLPIWSKENGPLDLIGDVHGCYDELVLLLDKLGYTVDDDDVWSHPQGRKALFLGDLVDRGPNSLGVVALAVKMYEAGHAIYIPGNHCDKFARYLRGSNVMVGHGLETTVAELELLDGDSRDEITESFLKMFNESTPYLILDDGRLVVAHAGLPENFHGRMSQRIRAFSLFGEVTGETDEHGRPIRRDWGKEYSGKPLVVYGHTPVLYPRFVNNSLNLDQGCVFGGVLSAMRYPEREIISVPAKYIYWRPQ